MVRMAEVSRVRRFWGYSALAMGAVSTFVFLSPIFPIGVEAFVVGGIFFAAGAWALRAPELRRTFRRFSATVTAPRVTIDPMVPVKILSLARAHGGMLTISSVAIELNVPIDQAREGLAICVREGNATEDFDFSRGYSIFRFPEFTTPPGRALPQ